ncbi:MAG: winged helix-turn-helix domain-containing protein [Methanothrix sp.]|jgi:predicted transcriptional regulator
MNRKRSSEMIMQNILEVCSGGASKTKIVYQSNLNFNTVNSYMTQLKDNGLLDVIQGEPIIYKTTKKGSEFMRCLKQHHEEISKITSILVPVKLMTTTLICLSGAITIISSLNCIIQD